MVGWLFWVGHRWDWDGKGWAWMGYEWGLGIIGWVWEEELGAWASPNRLIFLFFSGGPK